VATVFKSVLQLVRSSRALPQSSARAARAASSMKLAMRGVFQALTGRGNEAAERSIIARRVATLVPDDGNVRCCIFAG
jgi:hypothetical protein